MPDQSLLLYTRRYLARNHLLGPQPSTYCRLSPIGPITDIRDPFSFSPSDELDSFPPSNINCSEKLILEHETAVYLSSILTSPDEGQNALSEDLRLSRKHRIEEPLVKEQRRRHIHRVSDEVFEEFPVGMGPDLGIIWDRDMRGQVWEYVRGVDAEKMVIGPEVLGFLQSIHRPSTPPSTMDVIEMEVVYCKPAGSWLMTPPLLPLSPVILPSQLKLADALDLGLIDAGETTSLIMDLAEPFMAADSALTEPSSASPSGFLQINPPTPSPIRKRPRPEEMMVEALLTPPASAVKKVRFADLELPPRVSTPEDEVVEDRLGGGEVLVRVSQELAQEQLQEADSTLRVEVPFVDLSVPKLPWEGSEGGLEKLRDIETWVGVAARNWGGSAGVGMDLSWRPFLRNAIKVPVEQLEGGEFVDGIVVTSGEGDECEKVLIDGLTTWGLETHREQEVELEPGVFTVKIGIETLLKRKKKRKGPDGEKRILTTVAGEGELEAGENCRLETPLFANPLDTFMALRSRVVKKSAIPSAPVPRTIQIGPRPETGLKPITKTNIDAIPETPVFPTPKIQLPSSPGTFIASTTLLTERRLFRLIKDSYPSATIIERDFSVPIIDSFAGITSPQNDSAEADLILSPLSGIIITSLQKIRQAPMPGQTLSTIRQRVVSVSLLYERLFVVILGTVRGGSDTETIAGFTGFAAGLRAGVHVRILKEDDEVAAKWVVTLMVREGGGVRLLEEETLWERFLRKAGFNAFAAQVVLRSCREGGLRAFLKMSASEKRRLFGGVVGERVMGRILSRIEGEWDI